MSYRLNKVIVEEAPKQDHNFYDTMITHIAPGPEYVDRFDNIMNTAVIVGTMQCGKTAYGNSLIAMAQDHLLNKGIDDSQISYVHSIGTSFEQVFTRLKDEIDFQKLKYFYYFNDDAPATEGQHSRRAMSVANVKLSQYYITIRHRLNNLGFRGAFFVLHATQVYTLLEKTFRTTSKLKIFKDYPDDPEDQQTIGTLLGSAYFRALQQISQKIWMPHTPEDKVEGLSTAVLRFLSLKSQLTINKRTPKIYTQYKSVGETIIENEGKNWKEEIAKTIEQSMPISDIVEKIDVLKTGNKEKVVEFLQKKEKRPFYECNTIPATVPLSYRLPKIVAEAVDVAKDDSKLTRAAVLKQCIIEALIAHGYLPPTMLLPDYTASE